MQKGFEPPSLQSAAATIERYALENGLTPGAVCDIFNAGLLAARILAPHMVEQAPKSFSD